MRGAGGIGDGHFPGGGPARHHGGDGGGIVDREDRGRAIERHGLDVDEVRPGEGDGGPDRAAGRGEAGDGGRRRRDGDLARDADADEGGGHGRGAGGDGGHGDEHAGLACGEGYRHRDGGHGGIGAAHGEGAGRGWGRGKRGRKRAGGAGVEIQRIWGERGRLCAGVRVEHADFDETPWGAREADFECIVRLERDGAIENGHVLAEVAGAQDLRAVQLDGGGGNPIRAVGVAVDDMECVGRGGAAWQGERVGELIGRASGARVLLRPEEHGLGEGRGGEGQPHRQHGEQGQPSSHLEPPL